MKRRLIALLLALCLLPCLGSAGDAPSHLYHFTCLEEAPEELAAALSGLLGPDAEIVDGYATLRFGAWRYGQAVARDAAGFALCGLDYLDGAWQVTASHAALRQDEAPTLIPEAVRYDYTDEDVDQMDGCSQFDVVYADAVYSWFSGNDGWRLMRIQTAAETLYVTESQLSRAAEDESLTDSAFNVLPVLLGQFDISAFPTAWADALALAEGSEYADATQAVTTADDAYDAPCVPVYGAPEDAKAGYYLYANVPARVLAEKDGFAQVEIGTLTGWVARENLLIGLERAQAALYCVGAPAQVYAAGQNDIQPYYAAPNDASRLGELRVYTSLTLLAATADSAWYLVQEGETVLGWMPVTALCQTDNFHNAWIYSSDPSRRLNLREGPGKNYTSLGRYYSGVEAVLLPFAVDTPEGWTRVIIEGVSGWVDSGYLCDWGDYAGREWLPPLATVQSENGKGVNLRAKPSTGADILATCPVGTKAEILAVSGSWAHVRLENGQSGYMMLEFLGGEPEQADSNRFTLSRGLPLYAYVFENGEYVWRETGETLAKGTAVRVTQRPVSAWQAEWTDSGLLLLSFGTAEYTYVQTIKDGQGGYVRTADVDFWR
ncbi:MAG: SH3 domain-containing protein [Clostridia bacterium]|nr:SH3 domain-containing protein [Clostridia bacterium]